MESELAGNIALIIQVIGLLLLLVGVYPARLRGENKHLMRHGYLAVLSLILNLATVFAVMLPSFFASLNEASQWTLAQSLGVWLHVISGVIAIGMGLIVVATWMLKPLDQVECSKRWRLMMPAFVIWALALVLGAVLHIFEII